MNGENDYALLFVLVFVGRRHLRSFPTRRSSDLETLLGYTPAEWQADPTLWARSLHEDDREAVLAADERTASGRPRSEEHTSELQSLAYLVCRHLLKKKNPSHELYKHVLAGDASA